MHARMQNAGNNIPLSRQVQHFKATKRKMMAASTLGHRAAVNAMLSRSIFLIGVGSNDMFVFSTAQSQNKSAAEQQQSYDDDVDALYAGLISNYLFWDRVHPSQRAAMLTAKAFYDGPAQFTSPISFKQLLAHKI